jgi:tetratricopeptide (TPR) repeat protein
MISADTLETARSWYETGVHRIRNESIGLGLNYLDKAIAVFLEAGELRLVTQARHHKVLGYLLEERHEEVETLFASILHGYTVLEDSYGKALLLAHLGESLAAHGSWERANSYYNLASVIAENEQFRDLTAHIHLRQGLLFEQRDNLIRAARSLQRAAGLLDPETQLLRYAHCRFLRSRVLSRLGEAGEATAILEDAQSRLIRAHEFHAALEPLSLLRGLYEDSGMADDRNRIGELMHLCGQQMIKTDVMKKPKLNLGPPIVREEAAP